MTTTNKHIDWKEELVIYFIILSLQTTQLYAKHLGCKNIKTSSLALMNLELMYALCGKTQKLRKLFTGGAGWFEPLLKWVETNLVKILKRTNREKFVIFGKLKKVYWNKKYWQKHQQSFNVSLKLWGNVNGFLKSGMIPFMSQKYYSSCVIQND